MKMLNRFVPALSLLLPTLGFSQVVINEALFDDSGTDDREFVELFNSGSTPVDISGWVITGRDATTINANAVVPASTTLAPGAYYVFGNTGTLNVTQVVAANFLENDNETVELYNGTTLVDAFSTETNRGTGWAVASGAAQAAPGAVIAQTGPGYFGNHSGVDIAGTPLRANVSLARFVDGIDTNNNGRDFGLRPATPGAANSTSFMSVFAPADPTPLANGALMPDSLGSFVGAQVVDPTVVSTANPNAISAPNGAGSKAYVAWDPAGGGNAVTTTAVFNSSQASFSVRAYIETADIPQQVSSTAVNFRGSEITLFSIGSGDAFTNLTDLTGDVGLGSAVLPLADAANGFTGYAWVYERVAVDGAYTGSQKLHLVDANDGGDSDLGGSTPLDWAILKSYDLSSTASGWFDLSISLDGAGNGLALFNGDATAFTVSSGFHGGAFNVGYRENLNMGADATPDAVMRPATFTIVPEPSTLLAAGLGLLLIGRRRR